MHTGRMRGGALVPALALWAVASPARAAAPDAAAPGAARACAALAAGRFPDAAIDQAYEVPAGSVALFAAGNLPSGAGPAPAPATLPAHCLVRGEIGRRPSTVPGNTLGIGFELRMPDSWNGRLLFQGGGGWDGWLRQASGVIVSATAGQEDALARGFAVVSTDAGHRSDSASPPTDGRFAADPQARTDNATAAVTRTDALARRLVLARYGAPVAHAYFVGCSNGGRQGMLAAQADPDEFDGVVSGDPAFDLTGAAIAWDWNERALLAIAPRDAEGRPQMWNALTDADLLLLSAATARACPDDGAPSGACRFDVATLQCAPGSTADCLSPAKVRAIEAIQHGPVDGAGHALYDSWTQGGEAGPAGWRAWMLGSDRAPGRAQAFVSDWMRLVAVPPGQPPIDWTAFDFDRDPARIAGPSAPWQATGTDYAAFARHGGRILFYQGTADPAFSAVHLERYFDRLQARAGGAAQAARFARLFLVPGMAHCSGGLAFDRFDPLAAIVDWVEHDRAPDRLVARGASFPGASRPLCAYPLVARRTGGGDPAEAAAYACEPAGGR